MNFFRHEAVYFFNAEFDDKRIAAILRAKHKHRCRRDNDHDCQYGKKIDNIDLSEKFSVL